jgi:hypothetical protein
MAGRGMSDKGRWFRVYARQVREHEKFRPMSALELGAWMSLRSEAELRDKAMFPDVEEAELVLKRRRCPNPRAMVQRLVARRLFDVLDDGSLVVHDRADHDRPQYPSDSPEAVAERKRRSRQKDESHEDVTSRDGDGHDTHARVQPQPQPPANRVQPQPTGAGLPAADDSATEACALFLNGGRWLEDREYVEAWDDMDRRYGKEWVRSEIQPAYQRLYSENPKVKPWSLKQAVEFALAARVRQDEIERERAQTEAAKAERKRLEEKAAAATEEDKRRASITRRAIGLWLKRRPNDPVPTDFGELESWLADNDPDYEAAA